ncbi:MAG: RluA family pseudouridine synthase [Candidatus Bipolaricaulota bacterium]|nr:RluA family pseudouridine synthase [Candidatus Bipolaricaulota bacterium]
MERIEFIVADDAAGLRLDSYLAERIEGTSRSEIKRAILAGFVSLNGKAIEQPSRKLHCNDELIWAVPKKRLLTPAKIDLAILYEDNEIVVVDKPAGLVVHPGAGQTATTLVEGLLVDRRLPIGDDPVRPGIVHRLDKDTSGLIVVAKTPTSLDSLKAQFAARTINKVYLAQATGIIRETEGLIDAPIGRDPSRPRRMAIRPQGRRAKTEFYVLKREEGSTLLRVHPHTGRTHQIRVHLRYIDHPIIGDPIYGKQEGSRLMLHAWQIAFTHPQSGVIVRFEAPIPPEFPVAGLSLFEDRGEGERSRV